MSAGPRIFGPSAQGMAEQAHEARIFGHFLPVSIRPLLAGKSGAQGSVIAANGLVDTGASDVCIDVRLADELRLPIIDQANLGVVGGNIPASIRAGLLEVADLGFVQPVRLFALRMRRPTHDVILGRSFLQNYIVTFDGPRGTMVFHDPDRRLDEEPFDG